MKIDSLGRENALAAKWDAYHTCIRSWEDYAHFQVYVDGSYRDMSTTPLAILTDTWYHVTGTYDSATRIMNLYLNGDLVKTVTLSGLSSYTINNSSSYLSFGKRSTGGDWWFHGSMDDIRIYDS